MEYERPFALHNSPNQHTKFIDVCLRLLSHHTPTVAFRLGDSSDL